MCIRDSHIHRLLHNGFPGDAVHESELEEVFKLGDGRLIVETDKKLGFAVINEETYLEAYTKINLDQHFAEADISEDWYITNIIQFIHDAKIALPSQLSMILKPKDFVIDIASPKIGTLRLMPKCQKLKDVSFNSVHLLKCRDEPN